MKERGRVKAGLVLRCIWIYLFCILNGIFVLMTLPLALLTKRHYQKKMYKNEIGYKNTDLCKKKKIELIYNATCLHLKIGITFLICCEQFFNIMIFIECKWMCLPSSYIVHLLNKINIIKNGVGAVISMAWKKFANTVLKKSFFHSFF